MSMKKTDQENVTLDQDSTDSSSTFERMKSSFGSAIQSADDAVHPKTGKIVYLVFKILTILTFALGIPLFVLIYQFTIIDDAYTFENTDIVYKNNDGVIRPTKFTQMFTYDAIDDSIAEIENLADGDNFSSLDSKNVFVASYALVKNADDEYEVQIVDSSSDSTNSFFYSIFEKTDTLTVDEWFTNSVSTTFFALATKAEFNAFLVDNSSFESINSTKDAQEAFKTAYPPQKYIDSENDDIFKIGAIAGFTLIGAGIIFGLVWFWFSKFSKVPLKDTKETKEQE